ncbi:hypothetical protein EJ06DRAFT_569315 [Trichodelitschia bisporula]|uniref:DUF7580 domain-containing protein n=1 Tax=Trichodelitschia bisporula TaxID=703511 RepID=A0A6G1HL61_9PEZI|nr:hypothetical protein EJ06DRAFT_569315 [Trichodelitschia bisporula]
MSGVEVAGLVLGAFPIILNCLDYYRKSCEPLSEWWRFRTRFIEFADGIRHQEMMYNSNMMEMLHPIIQDNDCLADLVKNPNDARWSDGSLTTHLERHLAGEHERVLRIIQKMHDLVEELKKLLQIKDNKVDWIDSQSERSWAWHLTRIRISFSKGKYKKVNKLDSHNRTLKQTLGCSRRINLIEESRQTSPPVELFEKVRQHVGNLHNALRLAFRKCSLGRCRGHCSNLGLRGDPEVVEVNVLFVVDDARQEVAICPVKEHATTTAEIRRSSGKLPPTLPAQSISDGGIDVIEDLCSYLRRGRQLNFEPGVISDEDDRRFRLTSHNPHSTAAQTSSELVALSQLLEAHRWNHIRLPRNLRLEMAFHIASTLLQVQMSPWAPQKWSKQDFLFQTDSEGSFGVCPYLPQTYPSIRVDTIESDPPVTASEEDTRAALFAVGIITLELIFGHTIESCEFRGRYYGPDNKPNDHTDVCTARTWAKRVLSECGAQLDDVVRRCLDCAFEPRPNLLDKRFREAVYAGVVQPLAESLKPWKAVTPRA